jgi:hypothetical protein
MKIDESTTKSSTTLVPTNTTALITSSMPLIENSTTMTTNRTAYFNVGLTINDQFTPDLLDQTSPAYLNVSNKLKQFVIYLK